MGPEELCILALDKLEHERLDAIARDARATIEAELAQQAAAKKQEEEEANARLARHQARVATEQLPQQQHSARTQNMVVVVSVIIGALLFLFAMLQYGH
jgi:hypothetical protein